MRPNHRADAKRWLATAHHDVDDARALLELGRHNNAAFLAQQAAEKALQAYLLGIGGEGLRSHSAGDLCRVAAEHDPSFAQLLPEASSLDRFYIPTRYPDALPGGTPRAAFNAEDAAGALGKAERILRAVEVALAL